MGMPRPCEHGKPFGIRDVAGSEVEFHIIHWMTNMPYLKFDAQNKGSYEAESGSVTDKEVL